MSRIDELIRELCPEGVPVLPIGEVADVKRGSTISKKETSEGGVPVLAGGQKPAYWHSTANRNGENVVVAGSGAYAGFVTYWNGPIWASDSFTVSGQSGKLLTKFCFYWLKNMQPHLHSLKRGSGVPHVYAKDVSGLNIPVPPLEVQREIVSILDKFTQLEAELEAELEARRTQYEVTRDRLLDFSGDLSAHPRGELIRELCPEGVSKHRLGDVLQRRKGINITAGKMKTLSRGNAQVRIFAGGQTMVDVDSSQFPQKQLISEPGIIVKSRGKVEFAYWESMFTHKSEIWSYTQGPDEVDVKYVFYLLKSKAKFFQELARSKSVKMPQLSVGDTDDLIIPVPPLQVQREIVSILDKLDALVNDITYGLPAEIEARRKQYEYYRNKLLTFKELDAA